MNQYPALHMLIDGDEVWGDGRRVVPVINPATGETIAELPLAEAADLDRALEAADRGFRTWRKATASERASVLQGAARLLGERSEELTRIATLEQGKTIAEARVELMSTIALFEFYAGECHRLYGRELVRPSGLRSVVRHEPVGPVAAFAPWNFPIGNPGRKLGAAIAAGCSVILKAAEEAPASAMGVLQCLYDAGLPTSVAQAVFGVPDEVSRHLLASPVVRKLSFTGSTAVGRHLMTLASDNILRTTMELGGHAPVLVFADCDLERALDTAIASKHRNAGQTCVSPTRFIVEESIAQRFRDGFVRRAQDLRIGDGLDPESQVGPMANARRPEAMDRLVADAVSRGGRLETGGHRIGSRGFFYAPTVLSDVSPDAQVMNEEPFGPVAIINSLPTEEAMMAEANRLPFGLAAYAWTESSRRQRRLAEEVETGMLGLNNHVLGGADTPFGGVKWSGHGSEDGPEGVLACMVVKAVHEG